MLGVDASGVALAVDLVGKADDEVGVERRGESPQRLHGGWVPSALDSRDRGVAGGASWPAALGGRLGLVSIRALKSSQRECAMAMSELGIFAVFLRSACSSTNRLPERRYSTR